VKLILTVLLINLGLVSVAVSQTPFYQDKTISVILGGPPGGSADMRTRAVISLLRKHIPGNPTITMHAVHGSGGRSAGRKPHI